MWLPQITTEKVVMTPNFNQEDMAAQNPTYKYVVASNHKQKYVVVLNRTQKDAVALNLIPKVVILSNLTLTDEAPPNFIQNVVAIPKPPRKDLLAPNFFYFSFIFSSILTILKNLHLYFSLIIPDLNFILFPLSLPHLLSFLLFSSVSFPFAFFLFVI
ncbi:unnamed protein product [Acanthosepion pharaonis]|uniref:Uncharacterized protein n=1 Tax=Acanthosepion pharaonis TaxID=158019 RepID=A0A812E9F8_ACAPH|nr:unnamed protein product [Sepia pharaonis]